MAVLVGRLDVDTLQKPPMLKLLRLGQTRNRLAAHISRLGTLLRTNINHDSILGASGILLSSFPPVVLYQSSGKLFLIVLASKFGSTNLLRRPVGFSGGGEGSEVKVWRDVVISVFLVDSVTRQGSVATVCCVRVEGGH